MTLGNDHLHGRDQLGLNFCDPPDDERSSFGGNPTSQLEENAMLELALVSFLYYLLAVGFFLC